MNREHTILLAASKRLGLSLNIWGVALDNSDMNSAAIEEWNTNIRQEGYPTLNRYMLDIMTDVVTGTHEELERYLGTTIDDHIDITWMIRKIALATSFTK
jgi:hypothetical protein